MTQKNSNQNIFLINCRQPEARIDCNIIITPLSSIGVVMVGSNFEVKIFYFPLQQSFSNIHCVMIFLLNTQPWLEDPIAGNKMDKPDCNQKESSKFSISEFAVFQLFVFRRNFSLLPTASCYILEADLTQKSMLGVISSFDQKILKSDCNRISQFTTRLLPRYEWRIEASHKSIRQFHFSGELFNASAELKSKSQNCALQCDQTR